ncbi:MAG: T9SS type A sorting domain-containing protein, partial [Bacteroidales bacterium]|nr:T9SS type A sorting domain-containing protein [Bacteroidales bacterium]
SLPEYLVTRSSQHSMQASVYIKDYQKDARLEIFDINGGLKSLQTLASGQRETKFDVSLMSPGLYLLRLVYQNKQVTTVKFVKE